MSSATYPIIEQATDRVDSELDIIASERSAFTTFLARISDLPVNQTSEARSVSAPAVAMHIDSQRPATSIKQIRTAYRNTVMSVPHHDVEYGDTLVENLGREFNSELAERLTNGTVLTQPVYAALVTAATNRRNTRDTMQTDLRRERNSLLTTTDALEDIEIRAYDIGNELTGTSGSESQVQRDLAHLEYRCADLLETRQRVIRRRSIADWNGINTGSLAAYLYDDLKTTTPALSAIGSCLTTIRTLQRGM